MRSISALLIVLLTLLFPASAPPRPCSDEVTQEQLKAVFAAFQKARSRDFDIESMVAIYKLENAAPAVKKLVDLSQSQPDFSISQADSQRMEATRDQMNQLVLNHLAEVTGGSVEVINFGKQNGIRSDKDQTIYATDGKRYYEATEMKEAYERHFMETFGIDMERMDMSMFDGDAAIPDWRDARLTFEEYVTRYEKGQAKLEQNPEAYREAGTFRAQVDGRTASQGRVRLTKKNLETGEFEVIHGRAEEMASRYKTWTADVPYRNAMDSSVENKGRFEHASDFIDKMKYFNRTIGNGLNALALENWDVDYIFHLNSLPDDKSRRAFIRQMVEDTYVIDASPAQRETFARVIEVAAQIELDKMNGRTQAESAYLESLIRVEKKNASSRGETPDSAELLSRARARFFDLQLQVMDRNIVATARQKIRRDFDPEHLKKIGRKYGFEEARKLRWETARQITRAFEKISDPKLAQKLVDDAPEHLRVELDGLRRIARSRSEEKRRRAKLKLEKSSPRAALEEGPKEKLLDQKKKSFLESRREEVDELIDRIKARYEDFEEGLYKGRYSDEAVTEAMRKRVLDSLGFEERATFEELEIQYRLQFKGSKLLRNVVNLGNVNSLISCIQVYQQTGDLTKVAQVAVWELVSNVPGVAQLATLKQSFNDGNYESLSWLFIAWQMPAAGQVKMVFDVAANTMRIVYDHAMTPLSNDRFSQVYMGYVDKQPAGWSPLVPGWKERRQAAGLSILQFVPGETFAEKRTNMYSHFQAQIHKKLVRNGLDPTTSEYWERRDQILDAFFGSVVKRYFNAEDEFRDNTTAGLYAIAELPRLKARLIQTLKTDFLQGELNQRLAEAAREEMQEALENLSRQQAQALDLEKTVMGAESFLTETLKKIMTGAFEKASADSEEAEGRAELRVEVYPRVVQEGQEARIAVKASSAGPVPCRIEMRRLPASALVTAESKNAEDALKKALGESQLPFVKNLVKKRARQKIFVTRVPWEVTFKDANGKVLKRRKVSVALAGAEIEKPRASAEDQIVVEVKKRQSGRRMFSQWAVSWEKPGKDNCVAQSLVHPPRGMRFIPHAWVVWPDVPEGKTYGMHIRVTGGIPPLELESWQSVVLRGHFSEKPRQRRDGRGFLALVPQPRRTPVVGELAVTGELLVFDRRVSDSRMAKTEPTHRRPFALKYRVHQAPLECTAKAHVGPDGYVGGYLSIKNAQPGRRLACVSAGSDRYYGFFSGSLSFFLARTHQVPSTIKVEFEDYGRTVAVSIPVKQEKPSPQRETRNRYEKDDLKRLEDYRKRNEDDRYVFDIARLYQALSSGYCDSQATTSNWERYVHFKNLENACLEGIISRGQSISWPGWRRCDIRLDSMSVSSAPAEKKARVHRYALDLLVNFLGNSFAEMATVAFSRRHLKEMEQYMRKAEESYRRIQSQKKQKGFGLESVARLYFRLSKATFHTTGSAEAARSFHQRGLSLQQEALTLRGLNFKPRPFPFEPDPEFNDPTPRAR